MACPCHSADKIGQSITRIWCEFHAAPGINQAYSTVVQKNQVRTATAEARLQPPKAVSSKHVRQTSS